MTIPGFKLLSGALPEEKIKPPASSLLSPKGKEGLRDLGRTGARVAENIIGTPGDLATLLLGAGNYATGGSIPTYGQVQEKLPFSLPTTSQTREFGKELTGGILEPQSSGEALWDDIVSGFTNLALPIPGAGKLTAGKAALKGVQATAGALAGKVAENMGFGKTGQAVANTVTSFLTGLTGTKLDLAKQMRNSFDQAEKLSIGKVVDNAVSNKLINKIGKVKKDVEQYTGIAKNFAEDRLKGISQWLPVETPFSDNKLPLPRLMSAVKELNEFYETAKGPERQWLHKITQPIRDALDDYGKTGASPDWAKNYFQSQDIFQGFSQASKAGEFMRKHVSSESLKNPLLKGILFASPFVHKIPHAIGGITAALSAKEAVKVIDFMAHSKIGARAYKSMIVSAMNHNTHEFNKNFKAFDNALSKYGVAPAGFKKVS